MGRTLKELREAQGLTHEGLATLINGNIKHKIEAALRENGENLRIPRTRRVRDQAMERWSVDAQTVERWENIGFGVQIGTRSAFEFYGSLTFGVLVEVLNAGPRDMDRESRNITLQPGDAVVRPVDDSGNPAVHEDATGEARFLAVPDGSGTTFLKEEGSVTGADYEGIKAYREEEVAFVEAAYEKTIDKVARHETANLDAELEALRNDQEDDREE